VEVDDVREGDLNCAAIRSLDPHRLKIDVDEWTESYPKHLEHLHLISVGYGDLGEYVNRVIECPSIVVDFVNETSSSIANFLLRVHQRVEGHLPNIELIGYGIPVSMFESVHFAARHTDSRNLVALWDTANSRFTVPDRWFRFGIYVKALIQASRIQDVPIEVVNKHISPLLDNPWDNIEVHNGLATAFERCPGIHKSTTRSTVSSGFERDKERIFTWTPSSPSRDIRFLPFAAEAEDGAIEAARVYIDLHKMKMKEITLIREIILLLMGEINYPGMHGIRIQDSHKNIVPKIICDFANFRVMDCGYDDNANGYKFAVNGIDSTVYSSKKDDEHEIRKIEHRNGWREFLKKREANVNIFLVRSKDTNCDSDDSDRPAKRLRSS